MPTYISQEGLKNLEEELQNRKTAVRKDIAERIAAAKELGDLSENFEYQEAKEEQGMNEVRIVQLEDMIKDAVIVEQEKGSSSIDLGVSFTAEINGEAKDFEIVGSSEADPLSGKISNESPLGQALMGHAAGDEVEVDTPSGKLIYKIKDIK